MVSLRGGSASAFSVVLEVFGGTLCAVNFRVPWTEEAWRRWAASQFSFGWETGVDEGLRERDRAGLRRVWAPVRRLWAPKYWEQVLQEMGVGAVETEVAVCLGEWVVSEVFGFGENGTSEDVCWDETQGNEA